MICNVYACIAHVYTQRHQCECVSVFLAYPAPWLGSPAFHSVRYRHRSPLCNGESLQACWDLLHVFSCSTLNVVVKPLDNQIGCQIGCQMSVERVFWRCSELLVASQQKAGSGGSVLTAESVSVQNVVRQGFPPFNLQVVPLCLSASLSGGTGAHS